MKPTLYSLILLFIILVNINFVIKAQEIDCPGCIHDHEGDDMPEITYPGPKSPQFSENGNFLPANSTVRVLVVFGEVDRSFCGSCGHPTDADNPSAWQQGQLPNNIIEPGTGIDIFSQTYFDRTLPPGTNPTPGNLTDYYYQMSFGQQIVIGDYYPEIITVPCTTVAQTINAGVLVPPALNILNNKTLNSVSGEFSTKTGLTLADFDQLSESNAGEVKLSTPNGKIDCIVFVWRNLQCNYSFAGGGYAVQPGVGGNGILKQNASTNYVTYIAGSWKSNSAHVGMFKGEYMHALFGGNHWHSGEGAGSHTFLSYPQNFSLTSYSFVGQLACGYDRNHLGWYGWKNAIGSTKKAGLISAKTTTQQEVPTDLNINTTFPDGNEFILRDFVTYGDAIRIKLPYINWSADGDKKNQYLWLENHQKQSVYDKSAWEPSTCKEPWSQGIYAYIQVGKDQKDESQIANVYSTAESHPNGLGSWLFPLSAEGNYDFKYRYDLAGFSSANCIWGNKYLPIDKTNSETKPNPLTGMSDLYNYTDYDNNGILKSTGDTYQPYTAEMVNGQVVFTAYAGGDSKDAFSCGNTCPKKILSLGTNPAPIPIYTYTYRASNNSFPASIQNFENRTIYLNGISVQILQENVDGNGAVKVKVRFDDYEVQNDVRWCGNIVLNPNYQNPNANPNNAPNNYALNLLSNKTLLIDRGKSPTQHVGIKDTGDNYILDSDGRKIFTQPTEFTILPNAYFHTEENSTVTLDNGSTLTVQSGGRLELHGQMLIRNQGKLVIEDGAIVALHRGAKIIVEQDGILEYKNTSATAGIFFGNTPAGYDEPYISIGGGLSVSANITFTFTGNGYIYWKSGNTTTFGSSSKFKLNGSGKTDLLMKIDPNTTVNIPSAIDIQNGKIEYGANSNFNGSNGTILLKNLNFDGNLTANAFYGTSLNSFIMQNADLTNFNTGIFLENTNAQIFFATANFTNCTLAVKGNNLGNVTCNNITVSLAAGNNELDFNGFMFDNCSSITAGNCHISGINDAITLNNVSGFYLNGGLLLQNYYRAIYAINSSVFMRNGATIEQHSGQYAIEMHGEYNSDDERYTAMLTIGDVGCGNIRNSEYGYVEALISGTDFILNADAVQHAYNRANPTDPDIIPQPYNVYPNRFDGNFDMKLFNICYSTSGQYPETIFLNGNYWGSFLGNHDFVPSANAFNFKKSSLCTQNYNTGVYYGANIGYEICQAVDATLPEANIIYNTNSCQPWNSFATCRKGNKGGKPEIIEPPKFEECPAKSKDLVRPIHEVFKEANMEFITEDNQQTRQMFKDISELKLIKEPNGEFSICRDAMLCENPGQGGGNKEKISNPCAQLVMVAKVLNKEQLQARKANPDNSSRSFIKSQKQPISEILNPSEISVYPNPNDGSMTVEYNLKQGENGKFIIHDVTGRKISEYKLSQENNRMVISENKLGTGIFYYNVIVNDNSAKIGKLTIIR